MRVSYGRQHIFPKDFISVNKALNKNFLTQGKSVELFESKIKLFVNSKHAIVCNSGTSALHLAFLSIDVKKDDVILMPAINFIAAFNMSVLLGARVYLVDVDPVNGQMSPDNLLKTVKQNKLKKIKAIVTMYLGGSPENVLSFYEIKKKLKCFLIEDACHAFGSKYIINKKNYKVGSCSHADISTFSFHPLKTITTGEGGAVTTNNSKLAKNIAILRSHNLYRANKKIYWKYKAKGIGFNYRLSDLNCSLGISQISSVNKIIKKRNIIAEEYKKKLKKFKDFIKIPDYSNKSKSCYHLMLISIDFNKLSSNKDKFIKFMNKNNIYPQQHYIPLFKVSNIKYNIKNFSNTIKFFNNSVSLPIFYSLKNNQIEKVVKSIEKFIKQNK